MSNREEIQLIVKNINNIFGSDKYYLQRSMGLHNFREKEGNRLIFAGSPKELKNLLYAFQNGLYAADNILA